MAYNPSICSNFDNVSIVVAVSNVYYERLHQKKETAVAIFIVALYANKFSYFHFLPHNLNKKGTPLNSLDSAGKFLLMSYTKILLI